MEKIFHQIQYPFSLGISPFVEETHHKVFNWIKDFGLLTTEESIQRYNKEKYIWWAARTFPFADKTGLYLVGCWTALFFIVDDMIVSADNTGEKVLTSMENHVIDVLIRHKTIPLLAGNSVGACFSDLWQQMKQHGDENWQSWFVKEMLKMLESWQMETELIKTKKSMHLQDYIRMRPYFSGGNVCACLLSLAAKYQIPFYVYQHPIVQQMLLTAIKIASWANDIHSLGKELDKEGAENLVIILAKERKLSFKQALKETLYIHDQDVLRLLELERSLPSFDAEINPELTRYVQSIKALISGNHEWVLYDTNRYKETREVMERLGA